MINKHRGFTLVELVIVTVIIGLLLGSVMKGRELVNNAKIKNLEANFNSVTQAIYTYQERYNAWPGDDENAKDRFGISSSVPVTHDGNIAGSYRESTVETVAKESGLAWRHLRAAGLIEGSATEPTGFAGPLNAFGGRIGIGMNSTLMPWIFIGFTDIPNKVAIIFETRYDGQSFDSQNGKVRVESGGTLSDKNYKYDETDQSLNEQTLLNLLFSL